MTEQRVLAGRYQLERLVGRGGMAEVWAASDLTLERRVAVKLLLPRFLDDGAFRARFGEEARRAASLNHPNVVAVYDTGIGEHAAVSGDGDGQPFIVMELVSGRSLAEAIAAGGLTEDRALEVMADACQALQYAHDRGLIHRDIKPGNILLAEDGTVKVTDFGIARAIDSETVTQTAAVLGTAAYLSPEQAQAMEVDARSDVYALGVVLYELLAGQQPFRGDSAVTVAYQHVQELPRPPRDWNATVSPTAEAIAVRALAKNPANRYASAAEMREDLLNARVGNPVSAPAVLSDSDTALLDATTATRPARSQKAERRRRLALLWLVGLLSLLALAAAMWFLASLLLGDDVPLVTVPNVVGQSEERAIETIEQQGLTARIVGSENSPDVEPGSIARQVPDAGERIPADEVVRLYTSLGPEQVSVPDFEGLTEEEFQIELREVGLLPGDSRTEFSDEVDEGIVLSSTPSPGDEVDVGSRVSYVVSAGEELVRVPPLVGRSEADARFELDQAGLGADVEREFSDSQPEGFVVRQDPAPSTQVPAGDTVLIVVSRGPEEEPSPTPSPTESPSPSPSPSPTESPPESPPPTEAVPPFEG